MTYIHKQLKRLYTALLNNKDTYHVYSERNKYAVGAMCLDSSGSIVSIAFNSYCKTHPKMKQFSSLVHRDHAIYLHAEVAALIKAKGKAIGIIVTRLNANNKMVMAKPCSICQLAIKEANLDYVYYTNDNSELCLMEM